MIVFICTAWLLFIIFGNILFFLLDNWPQSRKEKLRHRMDIRDYQMTHDEDDADFV
jgi:hypothetical protein